MLGKKIHSRAIAVALCGHYSDAPAAAGSDYTATNGTVSFAAGQTSTTVSVPVLGDVFAERNEQFEVRLTSATGAWITDGSGIATTVNDDTGVAISDVSVTEGDSGTKLATFKESRPPGSILVSILVR